MEPVTGFAGTETTGIFYTLAGEGRPLVLLHSGIADHRMWADQLAALAGQFQVIAPDFRGYGKSSPPATPFRHFEDIFGLVRHLGYSSIDLAGCSLGGKVAMELAISHPEVVHRLVLVAPGLPGYEFIDRETLEKDAVLEELISRGQREAVADLLTDIWMVGLKRRKEQVNSQARDLVFQMILDNYDSVVDKYPEAPAEVPLKERLSEIKVPTLVMIGDCDLPDMQSIAYLVAASVTGAQLQVIPGAAHLPNLDDSALFNRSLADFLL